MFGALNASEIESITIVNRTKNPLLLDMTILREVDSKLIKKAMDNEYFRHKIWGEHLNIKSSTAVPQTSYLANQVPLVAYGKQEIVNLCINSQGINYTDTILYMQNGDTIFASSDFVNNLFDCLISYRGFTEL